MVNADYIITLTHASKKIVKKVKLDLMKILKCQLQMKFLKQSREGCSIEETLK